MIFSRVVVVDGRLVEEGVVDSGDEVDAFERRREEEHDGTRAGVGRADHGGEERQHNDHPCTASAAGAPGASVLRKGPVLQSTAQPTRAGLLWLRPCRRRRPARPAAATQRGAGLMGNPACYTTLVLPAWPVAVPPRLGILECELTSS